MKRRNFLKAAAAAAVGFHIVPRHVLGGAGQTPPSKKMVLAHIGISTRVASRPWGAVGPCRQLDPARPLGYPARC
ncbi:MAG: twin-arginine translocation signal domain-containing protein [Planctomycetota bacterium]|nr:twin-arginine translocation signal domain-containing protein [Planctomycetota bacterium]